MTKIYQIWPRSEKRLPRSRSKREFTTRVKWYNWIRSFIDEDTARYPEMEAAPELTMIDVMPAGKAPDTNLQ